MTMAIELEFAILAEPLSSRICLLKRNWASTPPKSMMHGVYSPKFPKIHKKSFPYFPRFPQKLIHSSLIFVKFAFLSEFSFFRFPYFDHHALHALDAPTRSLLK